MSGSDDSVRTVNGGTKQTAVKKGAPRKAQRATAAAKGRRSGVKVMAVDEAQRRRMIAECAYYRAEKRAFASGMEREDWLSAEAEIDAFLRASRPNDA